MSTFLITIGAIVVALTLVTLLTRKRKKDRGPSPEEAVRQFEAFKEKAEKIQVDLLQCEVVSNSYSVEELKHRDYRLQALDSLYGNGLSNVRTKNVNQSQLVFTTIIGGENYRFVSPVVTMDRASLMFRMDAQKHTTLYIDSNNTAEYYFDLEFLFPRN